MKAIVQHEYGSPDVLAFADVETPEPAAGEVLVRVHAASVNARDWHVLRGDPYIARPSADLGLRRPNVTIRGTDFAGRVEAVGPGVTDVQVGAEVYGEAPRAFAEYVAVPQDRVAAKPAGLGFEEAAALPLAANTALTGLRDAAKIRPRQQVLINGAAGGVGTFAVQIAKVLGATVTAVNSSPCRSAHGITRGTRNPRSSVIPIVTRCSEPRRAASTSSGRPSSVPASASTAAIPASPCVKFGISVGSSVRNRRDTNCQLSPVGSSSRSSSSRSAARSASAEASSPRRVAHRAPSRIAPVPSVTSLPTASGAYRGSSRKLSCQPLLVARD
ncbi:NAD(P)-dependent alcohol dehydrogenase [Kribbella sp. NPDC004138]